MNKLISKIKEIQIMQEHFTDNNRFRKKIQALYPNPEELISSINEEEKSELTNLLSDPEGFKKLYKELHTKHRAKRILKSFKVK